MMKNLQLYLITGLFLLAAIISLLVHRNNVLKADNLRQTANMANITAENAQVLVLKTAEYEKLHTAWKSKLDSTIAANNIKLRQVKGATIIETTYRDTGSVHIVYKPVIRLPDNSYKIAVAIGDQCWNMKGEMVSLDPLSKLTVTERGGSNSVQLVVVKQRRFLGLLWITRPEQFRAFSDCGVVTFTKIDFVKK